MQPVVVPEVVHSRSFRNSITNTNNFDDEYVLGEKLGCGMYMQIRLAIKPDFCEIPTKYAVKIVDRIRLQQATGVPTTQIAHDEDNIWARVSQHANCVRLHEVFHGASFSYFVMEQCSSSLPYYIENFPLQHKFTEFNLGQLLLQMLHGIAHLHSVRIVHGNIKPDKFMVGGEYGNTVKLGDFQLAAWLPESGKLQGIVGTSFYMSPEIIKSRRYDDRADVWSFGVTAYVLLFGMFPYMPSEMKDKDGYCYPMWEMCPDLATKAVTIAIRQGDRPSFLPTRVINSDGEFRTPAAVAFTETLLSYKVDARPLASQALKLEYMVAIAGQQHADGLDLPSLRPMVLSAARLGAFKTSQRIEIEMMEDKLRALQVEKHLPAMPNPKLLGKLINDDSIKKADIALMPRLSCFGEISETDILAGSTSESAINADTSSA